MHLFRIHFTFYIFEMKFTQGISMSQKVILYLVIGCLLLILSAQTYLVVDYFRTTRTALIRESNTILKDVFHQDLGRRDKLATNLSGQDTISYTPAGTPQNTVYLKGNNENFNKVDFVNDLDMIINISISQRVPLNINYLDSITLKTLKIKNINSNFLISLLDSTGKVINHSDHSTVGLLTISSKPLLINPISKESLQLTLLNPFGVIIKRMTLMLIASFAFAAICVLAFVKLIHILAQQKQLMSLKNDFFGNTAHELKRPVARLRMAVDSLSTERVDSNKEKKKRYLAISKEAVIEMTEKINMIMTLSMEEEGIFQLDITSFDICPIISSLREQFVSTCLKPLSIDISSLPQELFVKGDELHLRQTIANLIDNAIKYSGDSVDIIIRANDDGKNINISVSDNGFGIAPEKQSQIFTKYTRLQAENKSISGFGIGLSYVKTVVEKHGGIVSLFSQIDKGSEFIIHLPETA